MSSVDRFGNVGASYVDFSGGGQLPTVATPQQGVPSGVGQLGRPALMTGIPSVPVTNSVSGGDVRLGGPAISVGDTFSASDQATASQLRSFEGIPASAVSLNPYASMSLNDMAAELTMMMLENACASKRMEREMRAELAAMQFKNGMHMADLILERGELAFEKAVTEAVTKLAAVVAELAAQKIGEKLATPKKENQIKDQLPVDNGAVDEIEMPKAELTRDQKRAAYNTGKLCGDLAKAMVESTGTLIAAHFDLDISKIDAEKQVLETTNKLLDSLISSVDSSIRSQDSAIQFAMNMLQQLNSLAADSCNKIIGNIR
ncbi:MAG: hypothetical protein LBJ13_01610 [Puniceicoccales bacterium]|jgi:demethoxyubiquinone hydroxylase (CLK1/Coq7/Cat5 family)|nr:hypothetical protein [Puniceicoccales bacterium]